ncbi:histone-lysine N-methyltransferase [Xylona heveae TC161]|uniref:Histone-lysine N-methyltransferase, H3 lysine-79 specific n=1 Tax=Xylona heveae (strain CBS 132557 / TC161) TaxID=1328760 RepID=A0A165JT35_XYLHT|nr:histone-lysine N-methyltransferase [Xylona heveae TC161]KZF26588.1 histone-lysine N-methyltransferase [Xylona heveae TC161]
MGFFDHLQKKGSSAIKPQGAQIRREVVRTPSAQVIGGKDARRPLTHKKSLNASKLGQQNGASPARTLAVRQQGSLSPDSRSSRSRNSSRRRTPATPQRLSSSSEDSDSDDSLINSRKRIRTSASGEPDLKRHLPDKRAFADKEDASFPFIHASDIASLNKSSKFVKAFRDSTRSTAIFLQYPSRSKPERYELVVPKESDEFKALDEITQVVDLVAKHYVPESLQDAFLDEEKGFQRRFKRAISRQSEEEFREALEDYNKQIKRLREDGTVVKILESRHSLALPLVERVLNQIYARTVSPRVGSLRHYENGTDNVYGELLPRFISQIFKDTKLKSEHVFVDLGSGVGNVVLQAALEIGCESWGCEMMEGPCDLAELQDKEFKARARLWGLAVGSTHIERGDFLKNEKIGKVLQRADVVLVNNQAFTPQLNNELMNLFLDLREGCQIVSLKSFVPQGHKITSRNFNSPVNLLEVEMKHYWSDSVSWTDVGGTYFVARKDSSKLRAFAERMR